MRMKAIIIDDEINAIKSLRWEIEHYLPEIKIIKTFQSPLQAIDYLQTANVPDLVFLDIEMPEMNGFDFIRHFPERHFEIIFTTAYSEFALEALKNEAVDYLLKPIDSEDLIQSIEKLKKRLTSHDLHQTLSNTIRKMQPGIQREKIKISYDSKVDFFEPEEIIYIHAEGNYSRIFLENNRQILITSKIKELENDLPEAVFFRVHKSYIINIDKISSYHKLENFIELNKKVNIPLARSRKTAFLQKYL